MMIRLDKYLSDLGVASRKELKEIIRHGRITVNGACVTSPEAKLDPADAAVMLDGRQLNYAKYRYFAMDKPAGVLTATEDRNQKTVIDLLPDELKKLGLFPVGRLDKDTSGLLLLTNDGEYAHQVISPRYGIDKKYYAETEGVPDEADVQAFHNGIVLRDGLQCLPAVLQITGENRCFVTVQEGKYHQVRRMLASVGKPVTALRRLSIGSIILADLNMTDGICELSQEQRNAVFIK